MIVEDQSALIAALSQAETYGTQAGTPIERIDTHGAVLLLVGDRAYKLKRAVRFPYLDYSTVSRRHAMCDAELSVNRRTAPDLYLRVAPITKENGGFRVDGDGKAVDWLVVMRRFDQDALFDRIAAAHGLAPTLIEDLARRIAAFHADAEIRTTAGGHDGLSAVVDGVEDTFVEVGDRVDEGKVAKLVAAMREQLAVHADLLNARRDAGLVRRCHGDLHLRNICLIDGKPTLFDAIEFDEAIASIDVLYDLAFLLMDLEHRDLRPAANRLLNAYLARANGYDGLSLMPLFMALRASIRAHVAATAATNQENPADAESCIRDAHSYLDLATDFLRPVRPRLIAIGGLSGTGKSTLAYALAPQLGRAPGAVVLRSDEIRKRLLGRDPLDRLGPDSYAPEVSARVYEHLASTAMIALDAGQSVIMDAVYNRPEGRHEISAVASRLNVPFVGLWLEAPLALLADRVGSRRGDASDATARVVRRQERQGLGPIEWAKIDASGEPSVVEALARKAIRGSGT